MNNRWWTYQKERFPLLGHGPLVIVFCVAIMMFSSLQQHELPDLYRVVAAATTALIFFFQLRVADEFKDFAIDSKYRPGRPVPRGLVRLDELAVIAYAGAGVQFLIALSIDVALIPLLIVVWAYIGLMTCEFFIADRLTRSPLAYLLSHMVVMPLIAFYVSAFDWLCQSRDMPEGMAWLMLFAFGLGLVLEIGRKIRTPEAEREGVETYSAAWGGRVSIAAWTLATVLSAFAYGQAASIVSVGTLFMVPAFLVVVVCVAIGALFYTDQGNAKIAELIEPVSGLAALALYLGLGPLQVLAIQGGM